MEDSPHQENDMDVTGIAKLSTTIADTGTRQEAQLTVLKKAEQIQSATATQLIDAIQPSQTVQNLPPHLGTHIDTTA
jgi:hypothetical protein